VPEGTTEAAPKLQEATNEEIDAMLRELWGQRDNPKRGLSRDKEAMKRWRPALAKKQRTSTWGMVRTSEPPAQ
jgi:hypothetical protein